jgi:hypothetical protein
MIGQLTKTGYSSSVERRLVAGAESTLTQCDLAITESDI